ncbi:xylose repressor [Actinoplanes cyaneus]|uniref:Xylose repressor n=1 Tax=Actinoplanes cyaneus TaxID=52696 RepID=A0A919IIF8_9ACTN|nr:ROK family protein [Actinoplanes cyaneus]MCW2138667.1 Sugar kinase of the NBD/HSP70 family, may containing an N-terminal HTH domain [Actinoplanes cyaneus]GID66630.1 xylose repressor [Actinoplanes cyaneus]
MTTRSTELLRVVHRSPGVTRADAARLVGIGTGTATELVAKLSRAALLIQGPAAPSGTRGRPTTVLLPHPEGPLVVAVAITHEIWRAEVVELGGAAHTALQGRHAGAAWPEVRSAVRGAIEELRVRYGGRLRAAGISAPGTVSRDRRLDAVGPGWHDADLTALWPEAEVLVAGNDATLAATAESRRGAAVDAAVALHLRIEAGLGGAVVEDGRPVIGARGAAGEFGHMPFGDPSVRCPCGARGCWGVAVDGHELARLLGDPTPVDTLSYARRVITSAAELLAGAPATPAAPAVAAVHAVAAPVPPAVAAVRAVAANLGRGIAGLVNGLDADLVTLGGLGADLLATVPEEIHAAYRDGLMSIHRDAPPPIRPAALGDGGPIAGAAEEAWAALLPRLA